MESTSSTEVEKPQQMGADTHQDLLELRFDHIAGGAAFIIIDLAAAIIFIICKRKRKQRHPKNSFPLMPYYANYHPSHPQSPFAPPMPFQSEHPPMTHRNGLQISMVWHVTSDEINIFSKALQAPMSRPIAIRDHATTNLAPTASPNNAKATTETWDHT